MTALIAEPDADLGPFLIGIYYWKDGAWHREMDDDPPMPPEFFWVPEEEILPRVEANRVKEMLLAELDQAEAEAWKNLGRYKFWMFGYFAARWVYLNRIAGAKRPNPFKPLVQLAREARA